jgi:hypothetical protein
VAWSDRQRDFPGPLEPADGLASPLIGQASVDEARLDVSMTEVYEVDRLTRVEKLHGHRMTHGVRPRDVTRRNGLSSRQAML